MNADLPPDRQPDDSPSCGRAVFDNVGRTATGVAWRLGSQHCLRGHPRGARRGVGASKLLRPYRPRGRRQRPVQACHFRRFCGLTVPSRVHAWSQTSSEVAPAGSATGRGRVEATPALPIKSPPARRGLRAYGGCRTVKRRTSGSATGRGRLRCQPVPANSSPTTAPPAGVPGIAF